MGERTPHHLIRDRDRVYGEAFTRRIRAMGIRDRLPCTNIRYLMIITGSVAIRIAALPKG